MASKRNRNAIINSPSKPGSEEEHKTPSQGSEERKARDVVQSKRAKESQKRALRTASILKQHSANVSRIQAEAIEKLAIVRQNALKHHRARLQHIRGLLKQREEIEQRMLRTVKKVEDATLRGNRCLESSLVARLAYLKDLD